MDTHSIIFTKLLELGIDFNLKKKSHLYSRLCVAAAALKYNNTIMNIYFKQDPGDMGLIKGHPIEFMIILDPYFGPLFGTPMDPLKPILTY